MHRRVISVDIERAPVDTSIPDEEDLSVGGFMNMVRKAGALVTKAKETATKIHTAFKEGKESAKTKDAHHSVVACLDEAEKHLESLERGISRMQWMGNQQQEQGNYMPIHAMQQGPAMYSVGGPQYYRM
jgi:hypothetical protein